MALKKYASFTGRASRKEYWMFMLFNILIAFAIGLSLGFIGGVFGIGTALSDMAAIIYQLFILIPSLAVAIRRYHDCGKSGWWIIIPIVNFIFLLLPSDQNSNKYGSIPVNN